MLRINSATKNLLLVRSFGTPTAGKKSRSFARAQDDMDAIFRIATQSLKGPQGLTAKSGYRPEGDFFSSHSESWTRQNDGGLQLRNRNAREREGLRIPRCAHPAGHID